METLIFLGIVTIIVICLKDSLGESYKDFYQTGIEDDTSN